MPISPQWECTGFCGSSFLALPALFESPLLTGLAQTAGLNCFEIVAMSFSARFGIVEVIRLVSKALIVSYQALEPFLFPYFSAIRL